jgi:hypothetical protein
MLSAKLERVEFNISANINEIADVKQLILRFDPRAKQRFLRPGETAPEWVDSDAKAIVFLNRLAGQMNKYFLCYLTDHQAIHAIQDLQFDRDLDPEECWLKFDVVHPHDVYWYNDEIRRQLIYLSKVGLVNYRKKSSELRDELYRYLDILSDTNDYRWVHRIHSYRSPLTLRC